MWFRHPLLSILVFMAWLGSHVACHRSEPPALEPIQFLEVGRAAGLHFEHQRGATEKRYQYETAGAGALWFDADRDGWDDLLLLQSGEHDGKGGNRGWKNALYRNRRDGTFALEEHTGLEETGYAMGGAAADVDGDGDLDVLVTCLGPNRFYRNEGRGRFVEAGREAGLDDPGWGMSAAFADFDGDGWPDLYVVNYAEVDYENYPVCRHPISGRSGYCHPEIFTPQTDRLYRNRGDGTFEDVTERTAVGETAGQGMGVVCADLDNDRDVDIFVANDTVANLLFRNDGAWSFEEVALQAGVAFNGNGEPEACMGIGADDFDGDRDLDLFVTNFTAESNTLYRNDGDLRFEDVTQATALAGASLPWVGFGTRFLDYDNDGALDLLVVNGHIQDERALVGTKEQYPQPLLLFRRRGDRVSFVNVTAELGEALSQPIVGRSLALSDYDQDGDLDALVTVSGGRPRLLRNDGDRRGRFLRLRISDVNGHWPVGTEVTLRSAAGREYWRSVCSGRSYLAQCENLLHFGLGDETHYESIDVRWPDGVVERLPGGPADRVIVHRRSLPMAGR